MAEPDLGHRRDRFEPREPHFPPPRADDGGGGRARRITHLRHDRSERGRREAATGIAELVAIVDTRRADDGLQRRRLPSCDLQWDRAAPGKPERGDRTIAPRLARNPGDRLQAVVNVARGELIAVDALGIAAPPHIEANAGVTVSGEIGVRRPVAHRRMYSSTAGTGRNWASSGSHSRAAKLMPSDIGIQIFSCSTIRWGRSFSRFIAALGASLGGQPASSGSGVQTQTAQATATPGRKRPFAHALRLIARMQSSALPG